MPQICPLWCPFFTEGANLYVQITILHCTEKVNWNRMTVHWPFNCNIMVSPLDSAILRCWLLLPYFPAYQQGMGRDTSLSGTGTRSEDETTSLPQTHYAQNVPILPAYLSLSGTYYSPNYTSITRPILRLIALTCLRQPYTWWPASVSRVSRGRFSRTKTRLSVKPRPSDCSLTAAFCFRAFGCGRRKLQPSLVSLVPSQV